MTINAHTVLVLSGEGVAPYSARGITQTLEHINQASALRRTVNGNLKDLSFSGFRKYKSAISCNDQLAPALDGVWPGLTVTIDCVAELSYKVGGSAERTVVEGSSRKEGRYMYYRPRLTMKITDFQTQHDEYGATVNWSMTLEEI